LRLTLFALVPAGSKEDVPERGHLIRIKVNTIQRVGSLAATVVLVTVVTARMCRTMTTVTVITVALYPQFNRNEMLVESDIQRPKTSRITCERSEGKV
jgi:hypothetical protein